MPSTVFTAYNGDDDDALYDDDDRLHRVTWHGNTYDGDDEDDEDEDDADDDDPGSHGCYKGVGHNKSSSGS